MPIDVSDVKCRHLTRAHEYCDAPPFVLIPYGMSAVGACSKHVASVTVWAMNGTRTNLPTRPVVVIPAQLWDYYEMLQDGI